MVGPTEFLFLNRLESLDECGWDGPGIDRLWRYNQHYFDDLNALDADTRRDWHRALIARWIDDNPPASTTGWESYPTSLRIVNWVKWCLAGNDTPAGFLHSLAVQARWLSRRLERHLLGNHLFANAKALIFAGTLLGGAEGNAWCETGAKILRRELPEQILADGGHFELSPMYHGLALEDVLDLINILRTGRSVPALLSACERQVPAMQAWLAAMSHPDGEIAFFNDAAMGVSPSLGELCAYAQRLGFPTATEPPATRFLKHSGYARASVGDAVLLVDMAEVGPAYLPGHAHADTLSFEFSLGPQRIFVNGGTSVYGSGPERHRQRGSASHNCVVVAGANSSDVWSGFRVGRRALPLTPELVERDGCIVLQAGHDGYRTLPGSPIHRRRWKLGAGSLKIEDEVSNVHLPAVAWFHLHPEVGIETNAADEGVLMLRSGAGLAWRVLGGDCRVVDSSWHPEFGKTTPTRSIVVPLHEGRSVITLEWE